MAERIARRRADRPSRWETVEELLRPLGPADGSEGVVLLDCVSFLLTNHLLANEAGGEAAAKSRMAVPSARSSPSMVDSEASIRMGLWSYLGPW
jgi:adenosyl cobinamide kinase/adenosyl cobinamide phosphate guanylyltransferase